MLKSLFLKKQMAATVVFGALLLWVVSPVQAASIPVTYDNFSEVETSLQMERYQELAKGINKFYNFRAPTPIDNQPTIRMNNDTLYSMAVVNVTKGAVITLPDNGDRYMSLAVLNGYGYNQLVYYGKGAYTLTPENVGSEYAFIIIRILVDAVNPEDVKIVNGLQDKITIKSQGNTPFKVPNWDLKTHKTIFDSLVALFALVPDATDMFGKKVDVNPVLYLVGVAGGFGGLPTKDAMYINRTPKEAGKAFMMTVKDVPVDGFWSIAVYNKEGYFFNSEYGAPNLNNMTATAEDGTYILYFGDCQRNKVNCLAIKDGWNYVVRLYRPSEEILSGKWTFPLLEPVK